MWHAKSLVWSDILQISPDVHHLGFLLKTQSIGIHDILKSFAMHYRTISKHTDIFNFNSWKTMRLSKSFQAKFNMETCEFTSSKLFTANAISCQFLKTKCKSSFLHIPFSSKVKNWLKIFRNMFGQCPTTYSYFHLSSPN